MAELNREDFLASVQNVVGDNSDDAALEFIANMQDTFDAITARANDTTNWQKKYEENDAEWRKKYRDRFFSPENQPDPIDEPPESEPKLLTYESLFETKG